MSVYTINVDTAEELIASLRWTSELLKGMKNASSGDIGFRGQRDAVWPLIPSAFRSGVRLGYLNDIISGPASEPQKNAYGEFRAVLEFLMLADEVGLPVPGDNPLFRHIENITGVLQKSFEDGTWPPTEVLETLAIAQHHGVPTRLLDFTYEPLVATFFAAWDTMKWIKWLKGTDQDQTIVSTTKFTIWAVDLRFIRGDAYSRSPAPEIVKLVTVPNAPNSFLRAQRGFFLIDTRSHDYWNDGSCRSLDELICERTGYQFGRENDWRATDTLASLAPTIMKLDAPANCASEVLELLRREGVTLAKLMPNYDKVAETLDVIRDLGPP